LKGDICVREASCQIGARSGFEVPLEEIVRREGGENRKGHFWRERGGKREEGHLTFL
jgi:hypothetical protein